MQAKDISDETFMEAVERTEGVGGWRMRWDVEVTLNDMLGQEVPEKVVLAKARRLHKRGVLHGCDCGCRGDWHAAATCPGGPDAY